MIRRLVDASYAAARDTAVTDAQVAFWLAELRSPAFLVDIVERFPDAAARSSRAAVHAATQGLDLDVLLAAEQAAIMVEDKAYWVPLRQELEQLRFEARRGV